MSTDRPAQPDPKDLVVVLGRLARLRDADVLTEEEFQRARVKIVDGWKTPGGSAPGPTPDNLPDT